MDRFNSRIVTSDRCRSQFTRKKQCLFRVTKELKLKGIEIPSLQLAAVVGIELTTPLEQPAAFDCALLLHSTSSQGRSRRKIILGSKTLAKIREWLMEAFPGICACISAR